ncbi:hypothetical protein [Sagittula salina]|uniref:Uncharacterized protein n=1 Tax=Sagittula salina TaxID=2820268 RepID=A0A940MTB2_9RHOB|nr:hypothetical protein [Sagittula salina]MBP0484283.1 hypothetical protein [Sagittula salina]
MDDLEKGRVLASSTSNIVRAWQELYPMLDTLWQRLKTGFADVGAIDDAGADDTGFKGFDHASYGWQFNVVERVKRLPGQRGRTRKPRQFGTISLHIRFCSDPESEFVETNWPWIDQACLIVGWHEGEDEGVHWTSPDYDPVEQAAVEIHHDGHGLWGWGEGGAYFFALPVFSMKSEEDLDRKVIAPLKALFGNEDKPALAATALAGTGALMPYPDKRLPT